MRHIIFILLLMVVFASNTSAQRPSVGVLMGSETFSTHRPNKPPTDWKELPSRIILGSEEIQIFDQKNVLKIYVMIKTMKRFENGDETTLLITGFDKDYKEVEVIFRVLGPNKMSILTIKYNTKALSWGIKNFKQEQIDCFDC